METKPFQAKQVDGSGMKRWSAKKQMDEYTANVEKMQQQKRSDQEKRRRILFGSLR